MKFKALAVALTAALGAGTAMADTLSPVFVSADSSGYFTNALIGSFTLTETSNVSGSVLAATGITYAGGTLPLQSVTFSFAGLSGQTDLDASATGFSYASLAAGTYQILVSGQLSGTSVMPGSAIVGAEFTTSLAVSPAPEPATYAMMLAGVGALGFVARRRRQDR